MKKFIFLTDEGYTQTPKNQDVENLQVLGWSEGSTLKQALKNLKKENQYLRGMGFSKIIALELKSDIMKFLYLSRQM